MKPAFTCIPGWLPCSSAFDHLFTVHELSEPLLITRSRSKDLEPTRSHVINTIRRSISVTLTTLDEREARLPRVEPFATAARLTTARSQNAH